MYLRITGEFSFAQIGEILEETENWARVTFYRGKQLLRQQLGKEKMSKINCNRYYEQMKEEITVLPKNIIEKSEKSMMRFLDKTKKIYLVRGIIWSFLALGILTCFIVDIAFNRKLTWSFIIDASIIYTGLCIAVMIYGKRNRFLKTLIIGSLLLLPLLWCIEYTVINIIHV